MKLLLLCVSVPEPGGCQHMSAGPAGTARLYGASLPVNMTGPQVTTACPLALVAARPHMASSCDLPTLAASCSRSLLRWSPQHLCQNRQLSLAGLPLSAA